MKQVLIIFLYIGILSCNRIDCSKIPASFKSYTEAEGLISHASFNYTDKVNMQKSSWIKGAKYYSCDNQSGFFILATDKEEYIYQNLPINVWKGFRSSSSFGSYYNRVIKHRYQLLLKR
jgi:hypothetical protein